MEKWRSGLACVSVVLLLLAVCLCVSIGWTPKDTVVLATASFTVSKIRYATRGRVVDSPEPFNPA